jgi:general secretion pathway protein H
LGVKAIHSSSAARRRRPRGSVAGFTLLELLVTLSVIGLLASLTAPRFAAMMPGAVLRQTTLQLVADLRGARNKSIAEGKAVVISFDSEGRSYKSSSGKSATDWPENVQFEIAVPDNMVNESEQPQILFYPDGSSTGGEVLCSTVGRSIRVKVNWLAGWVSVEG